MQMEKMTFITTNHVLNFKGKKFNEWINEPQTLKLINPKKCKNLNNLMVDIIKINNYTNLYKCQTKQPFKIEL